MANSLCVSIPAWIRNCWRRWPKSVALASLVVRISCVQNLLNTRYAYKNAESNAGAYGLQVSMPPQSAISYMADIARVAGRRQLRPTICLSVQCVGLGVAACGNACFGFGLVPLLPASLRTVIDRTPRFAACCTWGVFVRPVWLGRWLCFLQDAPRVYPRGENDVLVLNADDAFAHWLAVAAELLVMLFCQ